MPPSADLTRSPARHEVEPLELFFDLVYVFAIGQLSHQLLEHPTWSGAAQTLVLYLAVFSAWMYTAWAGSMLVTDHPRTRRMLLLVMLGGLFMNAAIPRAFDDAGWVFVVTYLAIQLGRGGWLLTVGIGPVNQDHMTRSLIWTVATTPLWLAGAAVAGHARLGWWAAAALIDVVGVWLAHPLPRRTLHSRRVTFAGRHLLERCRLFTLIALGEAVLTTGIALADAPIALMTLISGTVALAGTVALFWIYFRRSERIVQRHLDRTDDPIRAGRSAVYGLMIGVAGLVVTAVGDARVIADPHQTAGLTTNLLLFGGPALYIAPMTWYFATVIGSVRISRLLTLGALATGCVATLAVPAYWAAISAAAIVVGLALYDSLSVDAGEPAGSVP
ncbi:low temperature requirement protein LtrA [Hamadaea flava]|uniref:Low temperature requirement protein A n=1 Tax=Hamadaea flava TaxID=1742688 RepID=A0ABV8LXM1_9ACTN|nr:low temperature requirement protein A [Hamadaea flava]MCP2329091.1 low temperature requirement protein LtrA [Hamadaea flava]